MSVAGVDDEENRTDSLVLRTELCLRRAAFRVLSASPSASISIKSRSITSFAAPTSRSNTQKTAFVTLQRRWASEEAATQNEPEADGARETQHGDNSIAASANADADTCTPEPVTKHEETATSSTLESAAESAKEYASTAASQASNAAQSATESVTGTAQSLGAAAGFGSPRNPENPGGSRGNYPAQDGEPSTTVYVGNLYFDVRGEDLKKEFERAGPVVESKVIMDHRGLSKGFGYVEFDSVSSASRAIELFNMQNFEGRRLSVQYSIRRQNKNRYDSGTQNVRFNKPLNDPTRTLFIGNMSFDMSDRDLNDLFREIKNVIDVRVAIDRRTGQPRGFAHADFTDVASAEKALEALSGKEVCGRTLRVDYSTTTGRTTLPAAE